MNIRWDIIVAIMLIAGTIGPIIYSVTTKRNTTLMSECGHDNQMSTPMKQLEDLVIDYCSEYRYVYTGKAVRVKCVAGGYAMRVYVSCEEKL